MPNPVERWLSKRSGTQLHSPPGIDFTTGLLRSLIAHCTSCREGLDGHTYRFFSTHAADNSPAASSFLAAFQRGDWTAVHLGQAPAINQDIYVVYALACPQAGGMVLLRLARLSGADSLLLQRAVSAQELGTIRALCPKCQWISFSPSLQSDEEVV